VAGSLTFYSLTFTIIYPAVCVAFCQKWIILVFITAYQVVIFYGSL